MFCAIFNFQTRSSINNYIYSVIRDRVLPENPLTTLKRAGVDEK